MNIVAEISGNHNGSLTNALKLCEAAVEAGANSVKIQTFLPEKMTIEAQRVTWKGRNMRLIDLYRQTHIPWQWHKKLFRHCEALEIECFSSVFDRDSLIFLENLGCPRYKISSFEIIDLELIEAAAKTAKPVILSTGMASKEEIVEAWKIAKKHTDVMLLKCVSAYPARIEDYNLSGLNWLHNFGPCGVSDHTLGNLIPVMATAMGARMIEKHLKLDNQETPDSDFSSSPIDFAEMVQSVRNAQSAAGYPEFGKTGNDYSYLRRALVVVADMEKGAKITAENVETRRSTHGLHPHRLSELLGICVNRRIPAGTPLAEDMIDGNHSRQ